MKKKKSSEVSLADKDREAIANAAKALNAFDEEAPAQEQSLLGDAIDEDLVEASDDRNAADDEVSEDMAIWAADDGEEHVEGEVVLEASGDEDVVTEEIIEETTEEATGAELQGTELENFETAEIEDVEFLTSEQVMSIIESVLFSTDRPISVAFLRQIFKGTNVKSKDIRAGLEAFASSLADLSRGLTLEEVSSGYQLRTKLDNVKFLRQSIKARPFRLSGQALEVLSIIAYKQPVTKAQMDEIRGVESGHLLRALMEKHLVSFGEKSELPGKPMYYETTRKFLEIFGLRNIRELPSLHEIDQLIPEGIGDEEKKETLSDLTDELSEQAGASYSQGEDELLKITDELSQITTSSDFFEQEKERMRLKKEQERAQDIREAIALGDKVEDKDLRWLERHDQALIEAQKADAEVDFVTDGSAQAMPEVIAAEALPAEEILASDAIETEEPSMVDKAMAGSNGEPEASI
jgi:segregation and condensation protein B